MTQVAPAHATRRLPVSKVATICQWGSEGDGQHPCGERGGDDDQAYRLIGDDRCSGLVQFHDYFGDSWGVLFSHPGDFTPVCSTELGVAAALLPEFDARNVKLLGLSVDWVESHHAWESATGKTQGTEMNFPLIADVDGKVSSCTG